MTTRKSTLLLQPGPFLSATLLLLQLLLINQIVHADGSDSSGDKNPLHIIVLGDSISAAYGIAEEDGWVSLMSADLNDGDQAVSVTNASISGDTTSGGLHRLPRALQQFSPDIVIIELGGNDGLRGQSLKLMAANLQEMSDLALAYGAEPLILGMRIPSNYGQAYTEQFANTFTDVASETGAAIVPFLLEPIAFDRKYFQSDGVHPTADAQPLLYDHVKPVLQGLLGRLQKSAN